MFKSDSTKEYKIMVEAFGVKVNLYKSGHLGIFDDDEICTWNNREEAEKFADIFEKSHGYVCTVVPVKRKFFS